MSFLFAAAKNSAGNFENTIAAPAALVVEERKFLLFIVCMLIDFVEDYVLSRLFTSPLPHSFFRRPFIPSPCGEGWRSNQYSENRWGEVEKHKLSFHFFLLIFLTLLIMVLNCCRIPSTSICPDQIFICIRRIRYRQAGGIISQQLICS